MDKCRLTGNQFLYFKTIVQINSRMRKKMVLIAKTKQQQYRTNETLTKKNVPALSFLVLKQQKGHKCYD